MAFRLAVILGENQVMIYPLEHLLNPMIISCIYYGSDPLDLSRNLVYLVPAPRVKYLVVADLWFCAQPFTSRFWLSFSGHHDSWWLSWLCWFLFLVMNWMNWACSCFTLTWWFANVVDCHGSRVCVLFIWPLLHPWPWHTSSFTLWLILCLALLLLA